MPFTQHTSFAKPRIGKPISLQRNHQDLKALTLTFMYQELVRDGKVWREVERQHVLNVNQHYRINKRRGVIELLDHSFWQTEGLWRAADHHESLLYKGQVKHPQRIEFIYEHYAPEEVEVLGEKDLQTGLTEVRLSDGTLDSVDMDALDTEAKARLGYDLPKFTQQAEAEAEPAHWDWEPDSSLEAGK